MDQPTVETTQNTFRQSCRVRCDIAASPDAIWAILTDARAFPTWNSTVTSLEGDIAVGSKLGLKVTIDPKRTFHPKVTKMEPAREMEWSDGFAPMFRGVRTFRLEKKADGRTEFTMEEVFSGIMLPMIRGTLPDFRPAFEAFARDLARAAEQKKGSAS
jgi:hypothetical protein